MYRGYNLKINWFDDDYYQRGKEMYDAVKKQTTNALDTFLSADGYIDGSKLEADWFSQINADVFLSHSHKDEKRAIAFSWVLHAVFGLRVFIDSCVWGYANDLLRKFDNKYCLQSDGTYDYNQRNGTTSHIHMMLNMALLKMIDKTECIFFLNTPNSILSSEITSNTGSPWIYSELTIIRMIRQNIPERKIELQKFEKGGLATPPIRVKYDVDLSHLQVCDGNLINDWRKTYRANRVKHPLDVLYELKPANQSNLLMG